VCGIAGFVVPPGERADPAIVTRMVSVLRHRGPDAVGFHVGGRVALGIARLRVIDLETGDQPIALADGSLTAILNGEIYDFAAWRRELEARGHTFRSNSDTEVLVHAWQDRGERCLDEVNGMFALALWDGRDERLYLARDRMGEKPLHYAVADDGTLVFASELRALLAHPRVDARLDLEGLARYLAFDYVPDPHSILVGVHKLPPGHLLCARDGRSLLRRYWDIPFGPEPEIDVRDWSAMIAHHFEQSVARRLVSDVPVGCFVSGGIDSSIVAGTAARQRPGIHTFSVGYDGTRHDERPWARIAARHFGTRHEEVVVSAADAGDVLERLGHLLDEPLADMSFVPLHLLSRAAKGTVTVALTGDGGDELFAGYPTMAADWWQGVAARAPARILALLGRGAAALPAWGESLRQFVAATAYHPDARNQVLIGGIPPRHAATLLSPDVRDRLDGFDPYGDISAVLAACTTDDVTARLIYRYCKLYLAGQNLVNSDRASMAAGLELRAPFLDHTFVELMGRIPSSFKLGGFRALKGLLKRALGDRLPPDILRRGKQGFGVPFGDWFRRPLAGLVRDLLHPARLRDDGIFDARRVTQLVEAHLRGERDLGKTLWSLLAFELWRLAYLGRAPVG
jgi:asparagine synthase (glutamine-hydrolysing)